MQTVIPIAVLALSGASFLAYRHPRSYQKVLTFLVMIGMLALVAVACFDLGISCALAVLQPFVVFDKYEAAIDAVDTLQVSLWWPLGWFLACAYLIFVSYLLGTRDHDKNTGLFD